MGRSYVNFHKEQFKADLLSKNWDSVREERDVNKYWNVIEQNIRSCIDNLCPLKKIRVRNKQDPWITHEIIEGIHDKVRFRKEAMRINTPGIDLGNVTLSLKPLLKGLKRTMLGESLREIKVT